MNLQEEFYQVMTRLKTNSRAASTPDADARVTEMVNGLLVSKPAKKIEEVEVTEAKQTTKEAQPQVWKLTKYGPVLEQQQESKAASVPGINKLKAIQEFINSNGRRF
jgi:hypothetical protein